MSNTSRLTPTDRSHMESARATARDLNRTGEGTHYFVDAPGPDGHPSVARVVSTAVAIEELTADPAGWTGRFTRRTH